MICKTVRELLSTLNKCCYRRNEDNEVGEVYVCNLCGNMFLSFEDVIQHIISEHIDDTISDVDPTK